MVFYITQLSCQLPKMGGLVITLVIIMIGVRYDSIHALYMIEK